ncbi:MAG: hypothetical protein V1647_04940 [Pseudomonadota bacterium]
MKLLIKSLLTLFLPLLLVSVLTSCAHNFQKIDTKKEGETVYQKLKVYFIHDGEKEKLTVYSQINRSHLHAILDGVGKLDKHVFTMEIQKNEYRFIDHINGNTERGLLNEFSRMPLDDNTIFKMLDIKNPQPIVIVNKEGNARLEITVLEQELMR